MTSRPPTRRLVDVLKSNSRRRLQRNAAELAAVSATLPATVLQTRFLRNAHLISPKSLCVLPDAEATLRRHRLFAVYKPAFCPMRRSEARDNFHRVSVESFVEAALRSREVLPAVEQSLPPSELKLRVCYDLDRFASGPVVVSVSDNHAAARSLRSYTMTYDVLVAGHLPVTGAAQAIPPRELFPDAEVPEAGADQRRSPSLLDAAKCAYEVRRNAYYHMHAVSLLQLTITAPPTPSPPDIDAYVRTHLHTFVLGDPYAVGHIVHGATAPLAMTASAGAVPVRGTITLRGDCDFPRVFTHLREVRVARDAAATATTTAAAATESKTGKEDETSAACFHCRRCFDPLLQPQRTLDMKGRYLGLLDGSWTPAAECI